MLFSIKSAGAHIKKTKKATSTIFIPCLGSSPPKLLLGSCPNVIFSRVSTFYKTLRLKNQQDAGLARGVYSSLWKLQCNRQLLRQKQLLTSVYFKWHWLHLTMKKKPVAINKPLMEIIRRGQKFSSSTHTKIESIKTQSL